MFTHNKWIYFLLLSICLFSCRIEKRLYNDGYYVSWNKKQTTEKKVEANITEKNIVKYKAITNSLVQAPSPEVSHLFSEHISSSVSKPNTEKPFLCKKVNRTLVSNNTSPHIIDKSKKVMPIKETEDKNSKVKKAPLKITGVIFFDWILEFFIWVLAAIAGVISSIFLFLFSVLFIDVLGSSKKNRPNFKHENKTFKLVFFNAFNIACSTMTAILWLSTFVLLCYVIYVNFGIWWLLLLIVALLLIVPFILNLFGKMFGLGNIFRLP